MEMWTFDFDDENEVFFDEFNEGETLSFNSIRKVFGSEELIKFMSRRCKEAEKVYLQFQEFQKLVEFFRKENEVPIAERIQFGMCSKIREVEKVYTHFLQFELFISRLRNQNEVSNSEGPQFSMFSKLNEVDKLYSEFLEFERFIKEFHKKDEPASYCKRPGLATNNDENAESFDGSPNGSSCSKLNKEKEEDSHVSNSEGPQFSMFSKLDEVDKLHSEFLEFERFIQEFRNQDEPTSYCKRRRLATNNDENAESFDCSPNGSSGSKLNKGKEEDSHKSRIKERNKKNQQNRRKNMSASEKHREREKAKKRMRSLRKKGNSSDVELSRKAYERERRRNQRILKKSGIPFSKNMDVHQFNFEQFNRSITWYFCEICKKKQLVKEFGKKPCKNCTDFSMYNDMDPGEVPNCLKILTFVERQLISRIHPIVSLYKVKNCQFRYKGHIINLPQDVQEVADVLPLKIDSLTSILTFRLEGSEGFIDFKVRRKAVREALHWLKENNPFYAGITIDEDILNELPECGSAFSALKVFDESVDHQLTDDTDSEFEFNVNEVDDDDGILDENDDDNDCNNDLGDEITFTDIPNISSSSQRSQVENSLNQTAKWPTIGTCPINEFSTPGYLTMAFPTLFPHGKADYSIERQKKLTISQYTKHLMMFHDGRFSKDERFRYYIMNSEMRWNSLSVGNIIVKKNEFFSKLTVVQLKEHIKNNPKLIKNIMFYSSRIRTTRPYWNTRCSELLDMVFQVGNPTVFFSLSSADYHWPDIYRLLGLDVLKLNNAQKNRILSENPLLFDTFFVMRARFFIEHCFVKKFNVSDYWYRFEFQHRGSIHLHGVAWLKDAPLTKETDDEEVQKEILDYFDTLISCQNPNPNVLTSGIHPSEKRLVDVTNMDEDLGDLINTFQRHTKCSHIHCLRNKVGVKQKQCRYGFPKKLESQTSLEIKEGEITEIHFKRNDDRINKYNPWVLQTWRANMDFTPIVSQNSILRYIAKYASKSESKSSALQSLLKDISSGIDEDNVNCKKLIRKLLISTCAERDYSAQEVVHFLMGYAFYHSSREFVVINLKQFLYDSYGTTTKYKSILERYMERPSYLDNYNLYCFARNFVSRKGTVTMKSKAAVVRIFPRPILKPKEDISDDEISALFVFFCPWKHVSEVLRPSSINSIHVHQSFQFIELVLSGNTIDEVIDKFNDHDDQTLGPEFYSSAKCGHQNFDPISNFHPGTSVRRNLGNRKVDRNFDWKQWDCDLDIGQLDLLHSSIMSTKVDTQKFNISNEDLSEMQTLVFDQVAEQIRRVHVTDDRKGCVTFVQGGAGTGKSYLLKRMYNLIFSEIGPESVRTLGSTGISAKNVNGETVFSFLRLGRRISNCVPLIGDDLVKFQKDRSTVKFLLIDEFSMIGVKLFAAIESRIRQMADNEVYFGNLFVYFFGDCKQLPPIGDSPLFANFKYTYSSGLSSKGKVLLKNIDSAFILDVNYRASCKNYSTFLNSVATGTCTTVDSKKLRKRCFSLLPRKEKELFEDSMRICSTNELVDTYNNERIALLGNPIARVESDNSSKLAFNSKDEDADGLQNVLYISVGCKIMLRRNLNVSRGLINGAIGYIQTILYSNNEPPMLPDFVLVRFQSVSINEFNVQYVPLKPVLSSWLRNGIRCTRIQLPISLAWACTVHKSQGLGFDLVILHLCEREYAIGLLYVALSRVSKFSDIALLNTLTVERLNSVRRSKYFEHQQIFLSWLSSFL